MTSPAAATTIGGSRYYHVEGVAHPCPSANEVLKVLARRGLETWKLKKVARDVALDPNLQRWAANGSEWQAVKASLEDKESPEAALGTAVHAAIEHYFTGDPEAWAIAMDHPEPQVVQAHLNQFRDMAVEFGIEPVHIEQSLVHVHIEYAGTTDGIIRLDPGADPEHRCDLAHVYDCKTGKRVYPDVALQLAAYAHCTHRVRHVEETGQNVIEGPLEGVCPEVGYIAAVHSDSARLYPVELRYAWPAFIAARDVQRWETVKEYALADALTPLSMSYPF